MAYFHYECFCNLTYDKELTYEEVIEREEQLKLDITDLLSENNAAHIDFVPLSDTLQVQCAFAETSSEDWQALCHEMGLLAVKGIQGRMVLIDRNLDEIRLAFLTSGKATLTRLPMPEPQGIPSLRKIEVELPSAPATKKKR